MSLAHRRLWLAAHSRSLLVPVVATILFVGGLYSGPTDWHEAWATGCASVGAFSAWFVVSVDRAVPAPAEAMLVAKAGGAAARLKARLVVVAEVAALFTVALVVLPMLAGVLLPAPRPGELAGGALAVLTCAAFGGALGTLIGRPMRGGTAFGVVVLVHVAFAAVVPVAPAMAGPVGLGRAISTADATPWSTGAVAATMVTVGYIVAMLAFQRAVARWRG